MMLRKTVSIFLTLVVFVLVSSFRSGELPPDFRALLDRAQMVLEAPDGWKSVRPIENNDMNYEYALMHPRKKFEVRYAIRPLDEILKDYEEFEKNKKPGDVMIDPNKMYEAFLQATLLNISGGKLPEIQPFDKAAVKKEFNADWGAVAFLEVQKEFGQKYKYCMVIALHKDNLADAYYFYMAESKEGFADLMDPAFHSLIFK